MLVKKVSVNHSRAGYIQRKACNFSMARLSRYTRQRIHQLLLQGISVSEIVYILSTEGIKTSRQTV